MTLSASKALQLETEFLSGVDNKLEGAKGKLLRGSVWQRARTDETDHLRALMAKSQLFDRNLLKNLPANRRVAVHGFDRVLFFWKRRTGIAIASTLSPLSHYVENPDETPPPIGLGDLADHVRKLVGDQNTPHIIGVCSPSGFTEEAREAGLDYTNVQLVLIEPDGAGGWKITPTAEDVDPRIAQMFDPEGSSDKTERIKAAIDASSSDLLTSAIDTESIAKMVKLPEHLVEQVFEQVAQADPELRLSKKDGECLLYRGAPVETVEKKSMSMIDRIKQLFSREGDENEKINVLSERRAALAKRRDRIYEDIGQLESKEASLLEEGKAAKSQVPRRRIAAQLAQVRKDIGRQNTVAAMLNQQINIISTDIHNLTLIKQGEAASLPDTQELTENAVKAEEMLETLQTDAELVSSLETGMAEMSTSEEELAILREFEEADKPDQAQTTSAATQSIAPSAAAIDDEFAEFEPPADPTPPSSARKEKTGDAEAS